MTDPRPTSAAALAATAGVARIEASQIVSGVAQPASWAPAGYDETDIRVLEWIGSHRRGERKATPTDLAA